MLELHQMQRDNRLPVGTMERSIALTALSHCLKDEQKYKVVNDCMPIVLKIAKEYWRKAGPAGDAQNFNIGLSSALNLATRLDCKAARTWGMELWSVDEAAFPKNHMSFSTYIRFLEQYRHCDRVDALLECEDEVVSRALNVVLLSSLLDCMASRRGNVQTVCGPNIIAFRSVELVILRE